MAKRLMLLKVKVEDGRGKVGEGGSERKKEKRRGGMYIFVILYLPCDR